MWSYQFPRAWAANVDLLARNTAVNREDPSVLLNYHPGFTLPQDGGISILISFRPMRLKYLINKDEYWEIPVTA